MSQGSINRRQVLLGAGAVGAGVAIGLNAAPAVARAPRFAHPGLLHTSEDFDRIRAKLAAGDAVVTAGWARLAGNGRSQSSWKPRPLSTVVRGGTGQNYPQFYLDVHAAYQNALRWRIAGDTAHGDTARDIFNIWSQSLTTVTGNADRFLAAGIYGYQFANAAELMRGYDGFDLVRAQDLLMKVFYPLNDDFLRRHNGACITNYWANWDLCTIASIMAIGILCDDRPLFDRAVDYLRTGAGNGAFRNAIPFVHGGELGQWQESGRDQGHTVMGIGLMGTVCEMAWNQGVDLYGYDDNRFLKGAEYVARYNLGKDVPFTNYKWGHHTTCAPREQTTVSAASRGQLRPVWEVVYNHYVQRRGLSAPNVTAMAARVRTEGGGGDYGPNSGGYDQLGFGTLLFTRDRTPAPAGTPAATRSPAAPASAHATSAGPSASAPIRSVLPTRPTGSASGVAATGSEEFDLSGQPSGLEPGTGTIVGLAGATAVAATIGGALLLRLRYRRAADHRPPPNHRR
ncbi:hypothetical protein C1I99_00095 [Micromonospora deserti]|uniref:Alginate lyase domain-containing protein n=1 Tax=Micromonospora deserti TaxID=2070366 RepID=A0A2W2E0F5_9ACTN|nr:hypothetical protein C1I99_00095 [Micromonospora deserti]